MLIAGAGSAHATPPQDSPRIEPVNMVAENLTPETTSRLIVYYHDGVVPQSKQVGISLPSGPIRIEGGKHGQTTEADKVSTSVAGTISVQRQVDLPTEMTMSEARAYAAEVEADPTVKAVLVDRRVSRHSIVSNDTLAYALWNLDGQAAGATRTEPVWPQGKGSGVTVAVLDTGKLEHPDMTNVWTGGYDLISDPALAGDGGGRDNDPTDTMTCDDGTGSRTENPHGLMVASVIAARLNNNEGMAGVAPAASIMPVRVISGCGGYLSDVLDGLRWAVGLSVSGLPVNPAPAKLLNLSLGTTKPGAVCSQAVQTVIDEVRATGATIVVSTGNDEADQITVPASCQGVIAVTAATRDGKRASYGNAGVGTTLAAAGGGCITGASTTCTTNGSNYVVVATHNGAQPDYAVSAGTSFSAPHVTGTAALLLERNPARGADNIKSALVNTARDFAPGACDGGYCGAGLLDTEQALAFSGFTLTASTSDGVVRAGESASIRASISDDARDPTFVWRQLSGELAPLSIVDNGTTANVIAPESGQAMEFQVEATDSSGTKRVASVMLQVSVAPELAPIDPVIVYAGERVLTPVSLTNGAAADALRIDSSATAKGIQVRNSTVVWDEPTPGFHEVMVTPYDSIGAGRATTMMIEVEASADQDGGTKTNRDSAAAGGGGGAMGLHGALLLMLGWIVRRRLYAIR